jgi:hypothetical protein
MMKDIPIQALQKIRKIHERIAVVTGTTMAVIMCVYFFTFSDLINQGAAGLLWLELITTVLFLFGLIFLKRLALFITRLVLGTDPACRDALKGLTVADFEKRPQ